MNIPGNLGEAMVKRVLLVVPVGLLLALLIMPLQPFTPAHAEEVDPLCWAVIVGVPAQRLAVEYFIDAGGNAYPLVVKYPDDSARDLAQGLGSAWGEDHIKLLLDSEATKVDIYYAIKWLADVADADDTVLFYFCGHGYLPPYGHLPYLPIPEYVPRDNIPVYLCPYDCLIWEKSVLSDIQVRYAISDSELDSWLGRLDSERVVVILDICYAGSLSVKLGQEGRVVLMSCQPDETSWESDELEHAVFTHYVLQALSDFDAADINSDYELSAEEVFAYAGPKTAGEIIAPYDNVPAVKDEQHPMLYDARYSEELGLLMKVAFYPDARLLPDATVLTVDGQPYLSGELPESFTWASGSVHEFSVPSAVDIEEGTRLVFTSWDDGVRSASRTVSDGGEYAVDYGTQYLLTIDSAHGAPVGEGWYDSGSVGTISVSSPQGGIIRRVFTGWSGEFTGTEMTALVTMDGPKAIVANWRTDYLRLYMLVAGIMAVVGAAVGVYRLWRRFRLVEE